MAENDAEANAKPPSEAGMGTSPRRKPPVTIDLAATPVDSGEPSPASPPDFGPDEEPEPVAPQYEPRPEPAETAAPAGFALPQGLAPAPLLIAAAAGAIIALIVGYGLQATGILPTPAAKNARAALALAETLQADLAALQANQSGTTSQLQAVSARLAGVESMASDLLTTTEQLRGLDGTNAANEALINQLAAQLSDLRAAMRQLGAADANAPDLAAELAALRSRLDEVSARVTELGDNPPGDRQTSAAARAMAFTGLRAAADKGESFADALTMLRMLDVDAAILAPLEVAKAGVPSRAALAASFDPLAPAIVAASEAAAPDNNFFSRLWRQAGSVVTIRPAGPIAGTTPAAIVSRMRADIAAGDLAAALRERDGLPDAGKIASEEWARDANARVALDKAVAALAAAIEAASANR